MYDLSNNDSSDDLRGLQVHSPIANLFKWDFSHSCAAWRSGNIIRRINEVTLRPARLVLGWVTVFGV